MVIGRRRREIVAFQRQLLKMMHKGFPIARRFYLLPLYNYLNHPLIENLLILFFLNRVLNYSLV